MTANPAPGWRQHPDHRVDLIAEERRWRAIHGGDVIAESGDILWVQETGYDPVPYFPRQDVRLEHLRRSDRKSHCPFKGEASYFTVTGTAGDDENAAWSYEQPYDEMARLKERIAFYPDRVRVEPAAKGQ